jgi:histidinol-phosphate aminotransferase
VYIANPNNPTGTYVTRGELEDYFRRVPPGVLTVLDEAYSEYLVAPDYPSGREALRQGRRVVVLHTFSKAYGLAGLRIGYGLAPPDVVEGLERVRSPFNTSRIGQVAALAALDDQEHLERSRTVNQEGLRFLEAEFGRRGLAGVRSVANFILVDFGRDAGPIDQALLRQGVITRPMTAYGLPTCLRISVGTEPENRRLLEALDRARAGGPGLTT